MTRNFKISFSDEDLFIIPVIGDGSCFFHSIMLAINPDYIKESLSNRINMIHNLRKNLADLLDKDKSENLTWYNYLSRGTLKILSETIDDYSLDNMKKELLEMGPVDEKFYEYVSDILNIDLYIINSSNNNIVNLEKDFYYKQRNSICLYFTPGHYELLSVKRNDTLYLQLPHTDPFILSLYSQLK
jgi:hypothetical protein